MPERRPVPDFLIMVAIVAASLVIGGVLLVVVPRAERAAPHTAALATTRPAPTVTPARTPAAAPVDNECTDADLTARLVPPDSGVEVMDPLVWPPMTNIGWVSSLWDNGLPQGALRGPLATEGLEGCAYVQWQPSPSAQLTVVLMRLPTAAAAQRVANAANTALVGHSDSTDLVVNPDDPQRLVRTNLDGNLHALTAVVFQGRYAAFIRLVPADSDGDTTLMRRLSEAQYALLTGPAVGG